MKKTYFEAPALEVVKMQTMQMICGSANGEPVEQGGGDQEAGSKSYMWSGLEDDTEE